MSRDLINLVQDRINEHKRLRPEEAPFPQGMPFEAMEIWQIMVDGGYIGMGKAARNAFLKNMGLT